eukprot:scaffold11764_cov77-Isochrysis_galbana.AAC.1
MKTANTTARDRGSWGLLPGGRPAWARPGRCRRGASPQPPPRPARTFASDPERASGATVRET